ncbi:2,3-bisphosphoglycerate-independent phosphoglycerate mutase [Patescibacteria group bacterium]|nr:2,3-bisphosphoglycerate-independent phosphoglycerate mutase [Patescibacteria group bacterium]MBU1721667.1 2,3-bisphosphoglycerate-independent phosphoglycerate mutase [Patescibacteria group bacterium]MBU1900976.1 2,3-bisphosphoglycerate-independent phosphoglycerate mutase [Patescibacteria group bacterium]
MKQTTKETTAPLVLAILDGFGLNEHAKDGNAITKETAPYLYGLMKEYPTTVVAAHGKAVGLFKDQEGNSEAGHLNIGAGRIVKQDLVHITEAIEDGTFFKNEACKQAIYHAKKYNTAVHIMGLLTNGQSAHASPKHLYALLKLCRQEKVNKVYVHVFTDGRDSPPHEAVTYLKELRKHMQPHEKIATVMGRLYAMDRNKIWERTKKAYEAMVLGKGICHMHSAEEAIAQAYSRGETDEFIQPTVVYDGKKPVGPIQDNDVILFFNARSDRARQITKAFVQPQFKKMNPGAFTRTKRPKNIRFVAMTDFGPDLPDIFTAFPSADLVNTLPQVLGDHMKQLYISETEKYAHVTYFMNGGHADIVNGEDRKLISSSGHDSYADYPQMKAKEITDVILTSLEKNTYQFICVNYPNVDMVGHTGNIEAAKKAVHVVDTQIKRLVTQIKKVGGTLMIIADHGNAEQMVNKQTGAVLTEHTTNPVPCIIVSEPVVHKRLRAKGILADIAPTVLDVLDIPKPKEMTGKSLMM